jgi:oxygen-dependent protoporphyrinogen oxidase
MASAAIESRKSRSYVGGGELLNVMLSGSAACRLLHASEDRLLAELMPELEQYFPAIEQDIESVSVHRWSEGEPRSPVGRSRDIHEYRQCWHPDKKVVLAGDYMGLPCTEGAAESGKWAAAVLSY